MEEAAGIGSTAPRSMIVVHGVGDQRRGETGRNLADAIGRELGRELGERSTVTIRQREDVLRSAPVSSGDENQVCAEVIDVGWQDGGRDHSLPIYELYWADESRAGEDLVGRVLSSWQLFVGLPRLGLHALSYPMKGFPGMLLGVVRGLYCLAWVAVVLRLLAGLLVAYLATSVRLSSLRQAELSLPFDMAVSLTFLLFVTALMVLRLVLRAWPSGGRIAAIALTLTALTTQVVPVAVASRGRPSASDSVLGQVQDPQQRWLKFRRKEFDARWFYAVNTLPGFWPYFTFGLVIACSLVSAGTAAPLFIAKGVPDARRVSADPRATMRIDRLLARSRTMGLLLALNVLVISPLMDWHDFLQLLSGGSPLPLADIDDRRDLGFLQSYCDAVVVPFVLVVAGVLFSTRLRVVLAPLVELALDVMNYLPTFPRLDASMILRYLFGGRQDPHGATLRYRLQARMRALIGLACDRHEGPVLVVAHSLGTIIAFDALDGWLEGTPELTHVEQGMGSLPLVDLVTMGSPLVMLASAYPHLFGAERSGGLGWRFPTVRSWENDYRDADLIGRALEDQTPPVSGATVADRPLGHGGHIGYFGDPRVARRLLDLIRGRGTLPDAESSQDGTRRGGD